jgi:hypothetical protein
VRVAQPPDQTSNAGNLEEVADWGRLFFGYFILAKQKKVTSCRATPGEVVFKPPDACKIHITHQIEMHPEGTHQA